MYIYIYTYYVYIYISTMHMTKSHHLHMKECDESTHIVATIWGGND